uniref:Uncharacterized protein n=1 Tax=Angiostrongylus cantonensis TaxID=6313 RepID=A0A158P8L0_ANGCA
MSESLVTTISLNVADTHADSLRPTFSSMRSLNSISDGLLIVEYNSFGKAYDKKAVLLENWKDDIKIVQLHQRSFFAEEPYNKENHCELGDLESDRKDVNGDNRKDDTSDFYAGRDFGAVMSSGRTEATEPTLTSEDSHAFVDDCTLNEEIRQVEVPQISVDGLELPRASEIASSSMDDEPCGSTTHLLDESMVPLVGTPHPMTHIPVEGFFTFVERLPNQELPAISEENEGQSLRRQRKHACSSVRSHTRNGATEMPQEPDDIAPGSASRTNPEVIPELNYSPYAEVPPGPVHRRATSDNVVVEAARRNELRRAQEVEEIDLIGRDENVLMRPQKPVVRTGSNISNRCQSQVFLPELGLNDASTSVPVLDRNLSNSDPSINDEKPTSKSI